MDGFSLETGVTIHVKFTNANTASSPTLAVKYSSSSTTAAKPIVQYGTTAAGTAEDTTGWKAGAVLTLTYDGTSWVRDQGYNTNTWRGIQDNLTSSTNTTDSLSAKQGYLLANGDARDNTKVSKDGDTITGRLTTTKPINQIITGTGVAGGDRGANANPRYFPTVWTFDIGMAATDGDIIAIKTPCAGHDYGVYMSVDGGTNYYPVSRYYVYRLTTQYPAGGILLLAFDSSATTNDMLPKAGGTSTTRSVISNGAWRILNDYDSGNDTAIRSHSPRTYKVGSTAITAYDLIAQDNNGYLVPAHLVAHRVGCQIFIREGALSANGTGSWAALYTSHYSMILRNSGTALSMTTYAPVFLKGTIADGIFTPDTTTPYIFTKANCNVTGAYYMYVGDANSATNINFTEYHPYYYYNGTNLLLYTEQAGNATTVNGHTVAADVPSDAVFTDTTSLTITANASDGLWDLTGTSGTNEVTYSLAPFSAKQTNASFYTAATNPTLTTRLNYDGYLYATEFYGGGSNITLGTANAAVVTDANKKLTTRTLTNNSSNTAITASTNIPTMNTIYYGLVTVNNASQTRATGIYAPISAGTANQILISSGGTTAPVWSVAATLASATSATANTAAWTTLTLGNNANVSTTTAHSEGKIVLYSAATQAHTIVGESTTTAHTHTLPNTDGTLLDSENYTSYLNSAYAIEILELS